MFLKQALSYKKPFWFYLLGIFIVFIFNIVGQLPLTYFLMQGGISTIDPIALPQNLDKNVQLLLLLIPFAISLMGLWLVVTKLHDRPFKSIGTSRSKMDWNRFFFAFGLWSFITLLLFFIDYSLSPEDYVWNFNWKPFLLLFFIGIIFIPFQTSFEEYIFRGYLMQGFAGVFRNAWMPLILTSLIFGLLHFFNPEVDKLGNWILIYYIGTGLFLGILTLLDEGLELALGFHVANNLVMALLVTSNWTAFQTDSLFIDVSEPTLGHEMFVTLIVLYPIFTLISAYKYNWTNSFHKLLERFLI